MNMLLNFRNIKKNNVEQTHTLGTKLNVLRMYRSIGLSAATRLCDIRVVTAMSNITTHFLSE